MTDLSAPRSARPARLPPLLLAPLLSPLLVLQPARAQAPAAPPQAVPSQAAPAQAAPAQAAPAQDATAAAPATPAADDTDFMTNLWSRSTLIGDTGGFRSKLAEVGLSFGVEDINEVFGNTTGGIHTGADYMGATLFGVGLDTQKAFGWEGGTFNISAWNLRGRSLTQYNLLALQTATGIEAEATTRLWEIYFQQAFLGGRFDIKIGQQSIDEEFIISPQSGTFLNAAMGWPVLPSQNMYAGGPAYPLSSLGVRLRGHPTDEITVLGGVFQDNPPGGPFNADGQLLGSTRWGGNFNLRTGALVLGELQYAINQPPADGSTPPAGAQPSGLPGVYKIGFWYDSGPFNSPRYDTLGVPLASPASNGEPQRLWNNYAIYAVADQTIWQGGAQALGLFARIIGAPGDRNLLNFSTNTGATLKAPLPTRDNDTFGVGFGFAKIGSAASGFNQDENFYGDYGPVRSSETFIEVTYQIQATGWWAVQPDFQYIFTPGGGIANPNQPAKSIGNEAIFGIRSTVTF